MSKIVDRDTFLYYLDNADVDWEATARECIAKGFELAEENKKLKEELAEANQLKDMYHTYYKAKHDDIKGIIFKQKEKLEKIKEYVLSRMTGLACRHILSIIEGAGDE